MRLLLLLLVATACGGARSQDEIDLERELRAEQQRCASIGGSDGTLTCPTVCASAGMSCPEGYFCEDPAEIDFADGLRGVVCQHESISNCWACASPAPGE